MKNYSRLISSIVALGILVLASFLTSFYFEVSFIKGSPLQILRKSLFIISISWILIEIVHFFRNKLVNRYSIEKEDNLSSRKLHTQVNIIEKVSIVIIIIVALGLILMSIDSIREVGIGLFASAGVAGIVLGLSAQKVMGTLLAGIQIAIAQPLRVDDAVVVENEWGWIEEINLTYVVVRLWDKRRLVLPTTYFIEKPFQNWTRTTSDIVGTVFLYTNYGISFDELRKELTRLLEGSELWDGQTNVLQVTDSKNTTVEIRILVSAHDSPTAWDLRVYIREHMIRFIQENYPESLPKTRVSLVNKTENVDG